MGIVSSKSAQLTPSRARSPQNDSELEREARRRLRERSALSPNVYRAWAALGGVAFTYRLCAEIALIEAERACFANHVTQSWRESAQRAVPW